MHDFMWLYGYRCTSKREYVSFSILIYLSLSNAAYYFFTRYVMQRTILEVKGLMICCTEAYVIVDLFGQS